MLRLQEQVAMAAGQFIPHPPTPRFQHRQEAADINHYKFPPKKGNKG